MDQEDGLTSVTSINEINSYKCIGYHAWQQRVDCVTNMPTSLRVVI